MFRWRPNSGGVEPPEFNALPLKEKNSFLIKLYQGLIVEIFVRVRKVIPWRCLCALRPSGEKQLGDVLRHRLRPLRAKDLHFVLSHIAKSKKISTRRLFCWSVPWAVGVPLALCALVW